MPAGTGQASSASADWSTRIVIGTSVMWLLMMLAMMLPSMTPMIATYTNVAAQEDQGFRLVVRVAVFIFGYFALWSVFSILAALLQLALRTSPWFSADGTTATPIAAGLLLCLAGGYQLTSIKEACLRHCRSPLTYLLAHWKGGVNGAFQVGLHHGAYCVGCCGVFMGLMFIFGTMTVWWMAVMAAYFVAEKLVPAGELWSKYVGYALLVAGILTLIYTITSA